MKQLHLATEFKEGFYMSQSLFKCSFLKGGSSIIDSSMLSFPCILMLFDEGRSMNTNAGFIE